MKIHTDTPLAPLTTLKVGGKAKYFTTAKNKEDFIQALNFAKQKRVPHLILGSGSNLLIDDKGFSGLVIHNKYYGIKALKTNIIEVSSGENWDGFVEYTVKKKLWGIECLSGIPGTVGAAPVQNIGAYGQEISETIQHLIVLNTQTLKTESLENKECHFSYRSSIFNTTMRSKYIVLKAIFKLSSKRDKKLNSRITNFNDITIVREEILKTRREKGMLIEDESSYKSAGSFFKNPILPKEDFKDIEGIFGTDENWYWETNMNEIKVSAAKLIEGAGFTRGYRLGNAGISPKHTLSIINYNNATSEEIIFLKSEIQRKVFEKFGVTLEMEVQQIPSKRNSNGIFS